LHSHVVFLFVHSLYNQKHIKEIYDDVKSFELEAANSNEVKISSLALSWLEEIFPEMLPEVSEVDALSVCRACAYAPLDASLVLQVPLFSFCCFEKKLLP
jgi:hypothetical protein